MSDVVPELLCMGLDLIICGCLYKAFCSTNDLIRDLLISPHFPIDENLQYQIKNHPNCTSGEETHTIPYAIIRGEVTTMEKGLSSNYAEDMVGVIQNVVFTEHKRKLSKKVAKWVDSKNTIAQYTNDAPFCLTNSQSKYFVFEEPWRSELESWAKNFNPDWDSIKALKRPHVEILKWNNAYRIDLDTVFDQFESAGVGKFGKHMLGSVVGEVHKGVQTTERMLTKGTTLTGIGELVVGPNGVTLQPPGDGRPYYLVKNSLSSLIKEMEGSRTTIKLALNIFIGIGVIISGAVLWKHYKKLKAKADAADQHECKTKEDNTNQPDPTNEGRADTEAESNVPLNIKCVVCLNAEREVILQDCGHVCVCADCADALLRVDNSCPVCKSLIVSVRPAYVS